MAMGAAVARIIFAREMKAQRRLTIPPSAARLTIASVLRDASPLFRNAEPSVTQWRSVGHFLADAYRAAASARSSQP